MAQFKPIMVADKNDLNTVPIKDGQFLVVFNSNELYVDKNGQREKTSQNIYIQADAPVNAKPNDVWFVTEE